jgi:hypothetical protein
VAKICRTLRELGGSVKAGKQRIGVFKRCIKFCLEFIGVLIAGTTVLLLLAAFRLSYGPVSLNFVTPYIERGLSADDRSAVVTIDSTLLTWAGWERTLDIQLSGVHVKGPDGGEQAFIPNIVIGFSLKALLRGRFAPTGLELFKPRLTVIRHADGSFGFGDTVIQAAKGQTSAQQAQLRGELTAKAISKLVGPPDQQGPLGYLASISMVNADLRFDDQRAGITLNAPESEIIFARDGAGLGVSARLNLAIGDHFTRIQLAGGYNPAQKALDLEVRFNGFVPAEIAGLAAELKPLALARLPVSGKVLGRLGLDGKIGAVAVDLKAAAGTLTAPDLFDATVEVQSAALKAHVDEGFKSLVVEAFTVDFNGPQIALSGKGTRDGGRLKANLEAGARHVTSADLRRLWPKNVAPNARAWVVENIEDGGVNKMRLNTALSAREDAAGNITDVALDKLEGGFDFAGLSIHYLKPLSPVTNVTGRAILSPSAIDFEVSSGRLGSLQVSDAKFRTFDLDTGIELLDLELVATGPVAEVVGLLDHPRLDLIKGLGIKPKDIKGNAATRLVIKFPLRKDLKFDHVDIAAASSLRSVALPGVALGNDLTDGDLVLHLDKRGMDVKGTVKLGAVPAQLEWTENFSSGAAFISRYVIKGTADEAARARFGLDFLAPYVKGPVGADLLITKHDAKRMTLAGALNLKDAGLSFADLGWRKLPGVSGFARLRLAIENDKAKVLERLTIQAGDLKTSGSITLGPEGKSIAGFEFGRLVYGGNDLRVKGQYRADGGVVLNIVGAKGDIRYFLNKSDDGKPKLPLDITVDLDTVRAAPGAVISKLKGRLVRDTVDWQSLAIDGLVGKGVPLTLRIAREKGVRKLRVMSNDAGAALKAFDIIEHAQGGTLNIEGQYDYTKPGRPLTGHFSIRKFNLLKAPFMAKLLSVASLTGILDTLSGRGISFDRADMPFVKTGDQLTFKDARVHGGAVGFTADGTLDLTKDTMNLSGTVVPAYTLNSVFADIPLIGRILVPEKGSGLFAATYAMRGPIANPDVTVNPLATLTPGFLRNLFNIFDAPEKGKGNPKPKVPEKPVVITPTGPVGPVTPLPANP